MSRNSTLRVWLLIGGLVSVVVLAALVAFVLYTRYQNSKIIETGDCVTGDETELTDFSAELRSNDPYWGPEKIDCSDPAATFVVHGVIPMTTLGRVDNTEECIDLAGVTLETTTNRPEIRALCVGPVGTDPATSINTVGVDDCIVVEREDARRAECTDPEARRVLTVMDDVSTFPDVAHGDMAPCARSGAEDAEMLYTWGLAGKRAVSNFYDKGVCLGPPEAAR